MNKNNKQKYIKIQNHHTKEQQKTNHEERETYFTNMPCLNNDNKISSCLCGVCIEKTNRPILYGKAFAEWYYNRTK